jgi:membrane-bound serine protease (ClpP class)
VCPRGARAASAGTYILYASHVAAMAPGTTLGAATPVRIGGPSEPLEPQAPAPSTSSAMSRKQVNDAAAYIRGLAQLRARNAEWAELAVRQAVSLSASEALRQKVVDLVAPDLPALLQQLDGRSLKAAGQERRLQTRDAAVVEYQPDRRTRFLAVITDPSVALMLMMLGFYGLILEFGHPGRGVPGILGAIALLTGLYALQLLPVNYAGMALILLGVGFMVAEAFAPSFGLLGLGGVAAFVLGALILIDTEQPGFGIPLSLIVSLGLGSALLIGMTVGMAVKARNRPLVSGSEQLVGRLAEVVDDTPGASWARVHGEIWRVACPAPLRRGQKVRILARQGLVLEVAPADNHPMGETA